MNKQYLLYHLRWQISGIIMYPVLGILQSFGLPLWFGVVMAQFVGALIFWFIDKWIFKDDTEIDICIKHPHIDEPSVSERKL